MERLIRSVVITQQTVLASGGWGSAWEVERLIWFVLFMQRKVLLSGGWDIARGGLRLD